MLVREGHPAGTRTETPGGSELDAAIGKINTVFQPIVDLDDGMVLGYEALARGPAGSPLESPRELFAAAEREDRTTELDWACSTAAMERALDGGVPQPLALFTNLEASTAISEFPSPLPNAFIRSLSELRVFFEITERALTEHPAALLERVAFLREFGCGIALDDVGADSRSVALMALIRPDVIKLDLRLLSRQATTEAAEIAGQVQVQAEATGAVVLAEGIEEPEDVFTAKALGATLGQGYLFGRPAPLPEEKPRPTRAVQVTPRKQDGTTTPREVVTHRRFRFARHDLLVAVSKQLESFGAGLGREGIIVGSFQTPPRFTPASRRRYADLAENLGFVAALAEGLEHDPAPGVRGGSIEPSDALVEEWTVAVIGPFIAASLVAREIPDGGDERRFEFTVTYDRREVVDIARVLLRRLA